MEETLELFPPSGALREPCMLFFWMLQMFGFDSVRYALRSVQQGLMPACSLWGVNVTAVLSANVAVMCVLCVPDV